MSIINLDNISKVYRNQGNYVVRALTEITLNIENNEMVAIMGRSGSGKSTLLNIIGGLISFDNGTYYFNGEQMMHNSLKSMSKFRQENIGFVLQQYSLLDNYSVFENISLPLRYLKKTKKITIEKITKILQQLQLEEKIHCYPNTLSGGECQRVAIARAIINEPKVILADEPTGSLDIENEKNIMQILLDLNEKGKTIVIVTHDETIAKYCHRTIYLENGYII